MAGNECRLLLYTLVREAFAGCSADFICTWSWNCLLVYMYVWMCEVRWATSVGGADGRCICVARYLCVFGADYDRCAFVQKINRLAGRLDSIIFFLRNFIQLWWLFGCRDGLTEFLIFSLFVQCVLTREMRFALVLRAYHVCDSVVCTYCHHFLEIYVWTLEKFIELCVQYVKCVIADWKVI